MGLNVERRSDERKSSELTRERKRKTENVIRALHRFPASMFNFKCVCSSQQD